MRHQRTGLVGFIMLSILLAAVAGGQESPGTDAAAPSKVGAVLSALFDDFQSHERLADGTVFASPGPMLRLVEDRVVIDAVASGETDALRTDLEALGMQKVASFGRMVSGQLPIRAINDANALESLQFARPAAAATNDTID